MANLMEAEYWPISSKSGENVEIFFRRIAALALETSLANEVSENIALAQARPRSLMQMNTQTCKFWLF